MSGLRPGGVEYPGKKTVCLDFDGVLHGYSRGWDDGTIYDLPIEGTRAALEELAREHRLVISTCREEIPAIWRWLAAHGLIEFIDDVTNDKPVATVYIDDRAVRFEGEWDDALAQTREIMAGVRAISGPGAGRGGGG